MSKWGFAKASPKQPGVINKTEAAFARDVLTLLLAAGKLREYHYEGIALKLADGVSYKPDFWGVNAESELCFWEVKGSFILDRTGVVKYKLAAEKYPFRFYFCQLRAKKLGWAVDAAR